MDHDILFENEAQEDQRLSPVEQQYLSTIRQLFQEQDTVRIIDVAKKLGHDRSKAHYWVKKLCDRGIAETVPKKGIIILK